MGVARPAIQKPGSAPKGIMGLESSQEDRRENQGIKGKTWAEMIHQGVQDEGEKADRPGDSKLQGPGGAGETKTRWGGSDRAARSD